jgi:predicted TIM-barrel fold metal-dependent hydrolase
MTAAAQAAPGDASRVLPAGSCDAHCHVFGPADRFPYAPDATFVPADAPKERLIALHESFGISRGVIVQSASQGSDHSALVDALQFTPGRFRGVALIAPDISDAELSDLDQAGVCGFRLNFMSHLGRSPSAADIEATVRAVGDRGWLAEIHVSGTGIAEWADMIASLPIPVVIDHMARIDLRSPAAPACVDALRRLLDRGNVWVKVSGIDRLTPDGLLPYQPGVDLARTLVAAAPERVVWGTDFPHVNIAGPVPDDRTLVRRVFDIAPTSKLLGGLLVSNPVQLFGFSAG